MNSACKPPFTEVETGKKATLDNRPQLRSALERCRKDKAVLVIAKLDRLAVTCILCLG